MSKRRFVLLLIGAGLLLLATFSSGQPSELCHPNQFCDSSCDNYWEWCVEDPGNFCIGTAGHGCSFSPITPACSAVGPGF